MKPSAATSRRVLVVPDKFKGTLSAAAAAEAIARGWKKSRPDDVLELLPMSDGGDGFGEILGTALGAKRQTVATVNAAHQPHRATWWWHAASATAIIEAAQANGLAQLPPGKFHPFQLDTFGVGKMLRAAARKKVRHVLLGIGGSATNDGGFGLARALGWKFLDERGRPLREWWQLARLDKIVPPTSLPFKITVAVDVQNPLLGPEGCSRIYGPQKGLRPEDFAVAEAALSQLASVIRRTLRKDFAAIPGAGAAGGLGFGLLAFAQARPQPGFAIYSQTVGLEQKLRQADLVLTGEGALDQQTLMGKGVGQIALLCQKHKIPCLGLAGIVTEPKKTKKLFSTAHGLVEITTLARAKAHPAKYLEKLAAQMAEKTV